MPGTPAAGIGDFSGSVVGSDEAGELLNQPEHLRKGGRRLRSPLVERVRLSLFVVLSVGQAHERETVPFVEATGA
jgi:hypothetical protein